MPDTKPAINKSNKQCEGTENIDFQSRAQTSFFTAFFFLFISVPLFLTVLWLDDLAGMITCGFFALNNMIFGILFRLSSGKIARLLWLFHCNIAIFSALIFAKPGQDLELLFLTVLFLPFLVFSRQKEPFFLLFCFLLPMILWFVSYSFGFTGSSLQLFGIPLIGSEMDLYTVNKSIRLTVFLSLVAEFGIFLHLASKSQEKLYLANTKAELASELKDNFVSDMDHEIRTSVNSLIGAIEVLDTIDQSPDQSRVIGIIRNSAFSLMGIIDDISGPTKIDAGQLNITHVC